MILPAGIAQCGNLADLCHLTMYLLNRHHSELDLWARICVERGSQKRWTNFFVFSGTDEPDAISVYSLFMERNVRYYFQHPYARLTIAYLITFCNFYM